MASVVQVHRMGIARGLIACSGAVVVALVASAGSASASGPPPSRGHGFVFDDRGLSPIRPPAARGESYATDIDDRGRIISIYR